MVGKDLIMATLLGSGGGSSGSGGGGSAGVSPKEVNFYDYDGTCVHAYTVAEAQALSKLPAGPEHPGLVFQGWNWSLDGVKGLTRAMNIGAMYTTDDGTTRLYITLQEGRTSPMLGVGVNGTVTVDWGDGTEPDVLTGTSTSTAKWTPNHAYAAPGDYVIRLTVDGEVNLRGSSSSDQGSYILRSTSSSERRNRTYQNAIKRVEIGENVPGVTGSAFESCYSLSSVTIPTSVTSMTGSGIFKSCYSLAAVVLPSSVTTIGYNLFADCQSLELVVLPNGVTDINSAFNQCRALKMVTLPDCVTTFGASGSAFYNCSALPSIIIPSGLTTVTGSTFYNCRALSLLVFPSGVKNILGTAFNGCYSVAVYDFTQHADIPTLDNAGAFSGIPDDCEIRVPAALYDEWIAATNWSTYADYIKAY